MQKFRSISNKLLYQDLTIPFSSLGLYNLVSNYINQTMHLFPFEYILSNSLFKFNFFILLKSNVSASVVVTSMAPEWIYVTEDSKQLKRVAKKGCLPLFPAAERKANHVVLFQSRKNPFCSSSLIKIKILGLSHNIEFINVYNHWCKLRIE